MRHATAIALLFAAILLMGDSAEAQEFRVYTRILDETAHSDGRSNGTEQPAIVARTLTLSHAGKVYDWLSAVDEVIVFEPAHRRFTILCPQKALATTVDFDQLHHLLKLARGDVERFLSQPQNAEGTTSPSVAEMLRFQLNPNFDESVDNKTRRLVLASAHLKYSVRWAEVDAPEIVATYLRYADWICRLNYVLHPRPLLPDSRLILNTRLRRKGVIPAEVELHADFQPPVQLRAEHQFHWELETKDRQLINHWERLLESKNTHFVPFPEYQRAMLQDDFAQER